MGFKKRVVDLDGWGGGFDCGRSTSFALRLPPNFCRLKSESWGRELK